jgi:hypothetical protein
MIIQKAEPKAQYQAADALSPCGHYSKRLGVGQKPVGSKSCDNASIKSGFCRLYLGVEAAENGSVGDARL